MNVRLIAGKFGGRKLKTPDGDVTHPMGERVRGALFNILGSQVDDSMVLDVFAGSGCVGLEALSRGANKAVFVERDPSAYKTLSDNILMLGVDNSTTVYKMNLNSWIEKSQNLKFDIIIADPPYDNLQLSTIDKLAGLLNPKGLMVLSYPGRSEVPKFNGFVVVDNRSYGNASLAFYQIKK